EEESRSRLGVDFLLKGLRIELHKLVSVARVAVFAADLTPAVRVDGPLERHVGFGAVQDAARGDFEVLHGAFGFEERTLGGEPGDSDQCHNNIFAFSSPNGKRFCWGWGWTSGGAGGRSPRKVGPLRAFFLNSVRGVSGAARRGGRRDHSG